MNPIVHAELSWLLAQRLDARRDRILVTCAGLAPDLDGLSLLAGQEAYSDYHHLLTHGLFAAVGVGIASSLFARQRVSVLLLGLAAFHLHLVCDLAGSGPGWPIHYYWPISSREWFWEGQWNLASWQNSLIGLVATIASLAMALIRHRTPVEMLSPAWDQRVVQTLHQRFSRSREVARPPRARSSSLRWALGGVVLSALLSPVWLVESLYLYVAATQDMSAPPIEPSVPYLMKNILWVERGEVAGAGVTPLWAGNLFHLPSRERHEPGQLGILSLARTLCFRNLPPNTRSLKRTLIETGLNLYLSRHRSEEQLKDGLVRLSYFGRGAHGVTEAARTFFAKEPSALTLGEMATLAGLLQAPAAYDPTCFPTKAEKRRAYVLRLIERPNLVTADEVAKASAESVTAAPWLCPQTRAVTR